MKIVYLIFSWCLIIIKINFNMLFLYFLLVFVLLVVVLFVAINPAVISLAYR